MTFAAINLCALAAALQVYSPYTTSGHNSSNNFQDAPQFAVNTFLFLAGTYSFLGKSQWSRSVRIFAGLVLAACNLTLVSSQFRDMDVNGGCDHGQLYNSHRTISGGIGPLKQRCYIQMVLGIISVFWGALLLIELTLTDVERKRELDRKWNIYRTAYEAHQQQQLSEVTHYYRPDMTLSERTRPDSPVEMEMLPAYEPRPNGPRPRIVDLAHMGQVSPPARMHRGSLQVAAQVRSPPPSYQSPRI
ncbi:hypothetical protein BG011_006116 [Mortierella polycephala]|uniref:Uncharacterized protein n=1 Tax=Mortierella polycephala TaxID=41804 RepID=A0A9P6U022_9FUNG|nr:hypothetical protein BG011_006116 [Mortierella polycephala]